MGPLTVGLQRYFDVDAVVLTTAADAHIGIEAAFSTPWLSGQHTLPPAPVRIGHGVDTELTQSGWSLRPVSAYFRGDFLACRSFFLDVGAAPEWFAPTTGANEFDLRFHVATGWSFGCTAKAAGYYPKFTAEYRGRTRLHADDAPVGYWDSVGAGLQFDMGKVWSNGYSRVHGFDLGTSDGKLNGHKLGYYAFATPLYGENPRRNAVVIALNTDELEDGHGGIPGRIEPDQWDWLERVLSCVKNNHPRDLMLVFAHHPLSAIVAKDAMGTQRIVADLLDRNTPNVVGYFYGHNHAHSICGDNRTDKCANYWEVETASLIEFPQEGRLVRIKKVSDKLAYFELTALHERLASPDTDLAHNVRLARRGAERDYCYTHRGEENLRCTADQRPYRLDGRDANARLFFALP
jgi:hypothetical protein